MINAVTGVQAIIINPADNARADASENKNGQNIAEKNTKSNNQSNSKSVLETAKELLDSNSMDKVKYNEFASKVNSFLGENNVSLEFKVDDDTKKMVLRIVNSDTKEVIQQVPPEIALKVARFVTDQLGQGQVTDAQV